MEMKGFSDCSWSWDAYAGAERWPNGDEPLIGHGTLGSGEEVTVIADVNGISVFFDKGSKCLAMHATFKTQSKAWAYCDLLFDDENQDEDARTTLQELRDLGFEQMDC